MSFLTGVKDIKRISQLVSVLASNSMGYYIEEFGLKWHLPLFKKFTLNKSEPDSIPSRLRASMEQLGGIYIKLGQFLSLRPDLAPEEYRLEFAKLQDSIKPLEFEQIKSILKKELQKNPDELFDDISEVPIGSASIAQVHIAHLKTGETVILKIKRPGVEELFKEDIEILYYLAKKIESSKKYPNFSPTTFVEEFERYTNQELNFLIEAGYIEKFYNFFEKNDGIIIPKIYREFTTKNLIVMQHIQGKKLRELTQKELKNKRKNIAETLVNSCLKQIFEIGTFHADLHPGNLILTKNNKIALIDFGIIGTLTEDIKSKGTNLYISLILGEPEEVTNALMSLGKKTRNFNQSAFQAEVTQIITAWHNTSLKQHRITTMMHHLLNTSIKHGLQIPTDAILLAKALVTVEGTCLQLDPNFNFVKFSQPYIEKLAKQKLKSQSTLKKFLSQSKKFKDIAYNLPIQSYELIKKLNTGDITIDIDDIEIKNLANNISNSTTMLSTMLIISAFIVAMALILSGKLQLSQISLIIIFISILVMTIIAFIIIKRR